MIGVLRIALISSALAATIHTSAISVSARSYKQNRHLDVNLDHSHIIRFSQCVDVKLRDDDLFQDKVIDYVRKGSIVSTKSFVLFHLCQNNTCFYESEDDLYMVDLKSYLMNTAQYHATKRSDYCDSCNAYADYCQGLDDDGAATQEKVYIDDGEVAEQEEAQDGDDQAVTYDDQRKLSSVIDCDQCTLFSCYDNDDDAQSLESIDDGVTSLIDDLANCMPSGQYWNDEQLYIGVMCSSYGDGVELAVFLDNECTVYTSIAKLRNVYQNYIHENNWQDLSSHAEMYIKNAFEIDMPCQQVGNVDQVQTNDDANTGNVSEFCQQIFAEGAVDFGQCYSHKYTNGSLNNSGYDEFSWYTYDMTYNEANDLHDVCTVVYEMSGEYSYSYNEKRSGTWYKRDKSGFIKNFSNGLSFSPLITTLFVLLGAGTIGGSTFIAYRKRKTRRMEPLYRGGAMI